MAIDRQTWHSIQHHMPIRTLDGETIGKVDRVEGEYVKVTKDNDGNHHWIPDGYIMRVDEQLHLNVDTKELNNVWRTDDPNARGGPSEAHLRHERSEVEDERLHKTHEQRNDQQ